MNTPMLTTDGPPYTMEEVMAILDCAEDTLLDLVKSGRFPGVKFGRHWVFPRSLFHETITAIGQAEALVRRKARQKATRSMELYRLRRQRMAATISFHAAKRRAARRHRTPPWADMNAIRAFYDEAHRLTRETGIVHNVDHVIRMQGALVSGLHVQNNLQILTGAENSRKKNHFKVV